MEPQSIFYLSLAMLLTVLLYREYGPNSLGHIPVVGGPRFPILSYAGAIRYLKNAREVLKDGCSKYNGSIFRVAQIDQWAVIVTGPRTIDEIRQIPEEKMSVAYGLGEVTAATYVFGTKFLASPHPAAILHQHVGRQLGERVSVVHDEMLAAVRDVIPATSDGWTAVAGFDTVVNIVARTTNRVFVGLPVCRDPGFLNIAVNVAIDVVKARVVINLFPRFMKPYIARLVSPTPRNIERCKPYLKTLIQQRMQLVNQGERAPQECLMHALVDEMVPLGYGEDELIGALFVLEFGALHSTAMSFSHALYEVAANSEYATLIREEAETVYREEGYVWSKESIAKLHRTDSLLKESQRVYGPNATSVFRKALTNITLSDGTYIPKDTLVLAAARHIHCDGAHYANPETFDPLRFVRTDDATKVSQGLTTPRVDFLTFGIGKHACPGRFFAALEMKMLLAHLIMTYDVQFSNGGPRPLETWRGASIIPNRDVKLYFKKRL